MKKFQQKLRRCKRIIVSLEAELILDETSYAGFIGNLSEEGIYMRTTSMRTAIDLNPGTTVKLRFQIPSGETLNLPCKIKWINETFPESLTYSIGMEVIDSPPEYKEFLTGRIPF